MVYRYIKKIQPVNRENKDLSNFPSLTVLKEKRIQRKTILSFPDHKNAFSIYRKKPNKVYALMLLFVFDGHFNKGL